MIVHLTLDSPAEKAQHWDRYVLDHPLATGYHLVAWGGIIERVFGHKTLYLMALGQNDQVQGVLPCVLISSPLFGRFVVSLPFVNYGGVLADNAEARDALLREAADRARELGAEHIELRHCGIDDLDWPRKEHKVSMRLDLPQHSDELMKSFPPKLRSQVRRGEKEGMTVYSGGVDLLDDFYAVFALNMRDLGTPVYDKRFFKEILQSFSKEARICTVYLADRPVAAGFVIGFRQSLEIPWASSDRRYARMAPNMMLYGSVLRYACEQGYRVFDFGRSSKGGGTYRFKEQWGAKPHQLYWYYWLAEGRDMPQLNPSNPKYKAAITFWRQLPLPVANMLGPHIVKYLP